MAQTSYPKVGGATTDAQYAEFFDSIIGTGVRDAGGLLVYGDSSGLNVKVAAGFAAVAGSAFSSTAIEPLTIAANTSGNPRIDSVILRRDFTAGSVVTLLVKQGVAAPTPSAPTLTQNRSGVWEEALADVAVANNAATITSANVTDRRRFLATRVDSWTTAGRPAARLSVFGLNRTTGRWEYHDGTGWKDLVPSTYTAAMISDPQNLTAGNAVLLNGTRFYPQKTDPGAVADGSVWIKW